MFAVVSLLDPQLTERVKGIWQQLDTTCGLEGIHLTPFPHLSWHVSEGYQQDELLAILNRISSETVPFQTNCAGIGLFSGKSPVLTINLVRNKILADFHSCIYSQIEPYSINPSPHYLPKQWFPHITLAHTDFTLEKLSCAVLELGYTTIDWPVMIENIALVYQVGSEVGGLVQQFSFKAGDES